jgi:hypothetical protein
MLFSTIKNYKIIIRTGLQPMRHPTHKIRTYALTCALCPKPNRLDHE